MSTLKSRDFSAGIGPRADGKVRSSVHTIPQQRHQSICDARRPLRTNIGAGVHLAEKSVVAGALAR